MSKPPRKRKPKRFRFPYPKRGHCLACTKLHRQHVKKRGMLWAFCSHTCKDAWQVRRALEFGIVITGTDFAQVETRIHDSVLVNIGPRSRAASEKLARRMLKKYTAIDVQQTIDFAVATVWPQRWPSRLP